jgi:hypothetical protein
MLAAHLENLLFLLLLALAGLVQLLGRAARKTRVDEEEPTPKPASRTLTPIPRAPAESDEERIRKFLEALGQPPASKPPPPVTPRTDVTPRPLAPVQPPPVVIPGVLRLPREQRRERDLIRKYTPPPEQPSRLQEIIPPHVPTPAAPTFEVHEALPAELHEASIIKTPIEAYAAATRPIAKGAELKTDIAILLASNTGLRDAIILREIFGAPRGLQPLEIVL